MSITILDSTTVDGTLLISSISNSATDTDRFVVSDGGVLKYRTGAQVRSDIGAGTGNGTVTSVGVSAGAGLSGGGTVTTSGTISLALDLGELGIGGTLVGTDYIIAENGGVDNRQLVSSIPLSIFNNNSGWTSNTGTVTSVAVAAGTGMSGGGTVTTSGTVTLTNSDRGSSQNIFKNVAVSGQSSIVADNNNDTLTFAAGNNITLSTNAATDTLTITANINPGDITGVTASAPLTGGGTSGNVTVGISQSSDATDGYLSSTDWRTFNSKTSNTGTVTSVGISHAGNAFTAGTAVTTSGTLAITMAGTTAQYINGQGNLVTFPAIPQGDITAVVAGTGMSGGGTSGSVTLTNAAPNVTTNLSTTYAADSVTVVSSDGTNAKIDAASDAAAGVMTSNDRRKLDGIADGATNVTNNNQLTNGAGYITDGNTGWNNIYGFITASSTNTLTNKSGNISQWTNDSGYTTNVGDITGVTAGTGISGGGTSGTVTITNSDRGSSQNIFKNVAVSGQTSIVADSNNDTLTFAAGNNITLTTNAATDTLTITANINPGDITGVTAGTGLSGGGTSGTVTLSIDSTVATLTGAQTFTNKKGNISQWTNDSGYTTNVGDITGVTAGAGMSGGGTSGTVTLTNAAPNVTTNLSTTTTATTLTVVSSDGTNATLPAATRTVAGVMTGADKSKLDGIAAGATNVTNNNQLTNGAGYTTNTGTTTASNTQTFTNKSGKISQWTNDSGYTTNVGDITGVTAGSGLSGGGTSGTVTLTNSAPNVTTNLSTITSANSVTVVSSDGTNAAIAAASDAAAGVMTADDRRKLDGIADGATNVTNNNQLTNGAGYTTNVGDITGVTAGTNLTGGGTSGTVTLNMATGGAGAGTYGSASDGTKIDTITLDAYGRVTAVTSGATGDIQGVTAGAGISGGGTSGTVTITNSDRGSSQNIFKNIQVDGVDAFTAANNSDILNFRSGSGIRVSGDPGSNTISIDNLSPDTGTPAILSNGSTPSLNSGITAAEIRSLIGAGTSSTTGTVTSVKITAGTGMSGGGTITSSGTITLNCTINTPSEVGLGNLSSSGNSLSGSFTATGNITAYSDERLKTDVETIPNALEKVNSLRGVTYTKDGVRGLGVIAQEIEKVIPEVVMDGEEFKSVAYGNIVGVLIEAIKELTNEVEELKRKLN